MRQIEANQFDLSLKMINQKFQDRISKHLQSSVANCDLAQTKNPQHVVEFSKDIL